ncbi:MAG: endonuclease/exonuclease/phosphatase family protein [Gemmatimonadales bacterium]
MATVLRWMTLGIGLLTVGGTLLNFSRSPHWFVRGWDYPRIQIALLTAASGTAYALWFSQGTALEWLFVAATAGCALWQIWKIFPYTSLAPVRVQQSKGGPALSTVRLLVTNVLMENAQHDRLLQLIRESDPDVVLALETDEVWARALEPVRRTHPHVLRHPRDNYYGLILFSRLPLLEARVEFLVQDDVPSVHASFEVAGERVFLYGLHPRPPEPIRDQDSTHRDAELVIVGRMIGEADGRPTIVAGDLNDVAWSPTSELFLRLSGLLDPRMGRGLYNSFNADNRLFRFPLDHVFHSNHFRLVELQRCGHIGSDHFPMLIELSYEPDAPAEQAETESEAGDAGEAQEKLEEQADAASTGQDRPERE